MEIYYLSNSIIPSKSANSVHVMKMCNAFIKNNNDVKLFARQNSQDKESIYEDYDIENEFSITFNKWPQVRYVGGLLYGRGVLKSIKNMIIENSKPDLLYGRDIYGLYFSRKLTIPLIYEAHVFPVSRYKLMIEEQLFRSKNFSKLVVISNALKEKYISHYKKLLNDSNVVVAHDACDRPNYDTSCRVKKNVGYVGHLYPGKGMEIIEKISKRMMDVEFHIIGGTLEDVKYWGNRIKTKNVIFHGYVKQKELDKYYSKFDIALAPYMKRVSGFKGKGDLSKWMSPLKIFEYMARKKTIIASNLAVINEVLEHENNCLLCEVDSIEEWIDGIRLVLNDDRLRSSITNKAYNDFINKYTWKKRAEVVIKK